MKSAWYVTFALFIILITVLSSPVFAQREDRGERGERGARFRRSYGDRIAKIMEDAGCPLSESQLEDIKKLMPGPNMQKRLNKILSEEQQEVLVKQEHERRVNMIIRSLENTDYPLSEDQIEKIKAVKPGPKSRVEIGKILNDDQKEALKEAEKNRRGSRQPFGRMAEMLKEAGHPLTEEQQKKMEEIEPDRGAWEKFREILTDEQKKVLDERFQRRQRERE